MKTVLKAMIFTMMFSSVVNEAQAEVEEYSEKGYKIEVPEFSVYSLCVKGCVFILNLNSSSIEQLWVRDEGGNHPVKCMIKKESKNK